MKDNFDLVMVGLLILTIGILIGYQIDNADRKEAVEAYNTCVKKYNQNILHSSDLTVYDFINQTFHEVEP